MYDYNEPLVTVSIKAVHLQVRHLNMRVWGVGPLLGAKLLLIRPPGLPGLPRVPAAMGCSVPPSAGSVRLSDREAVPACVALTKPSRPCASVCLDLHLTIGLCTSPITS